MGGWQDFTQLVVPYLASDLLVSDLLSKLAPSQSYPLTMEHGYGGLVIATDAPAAATITCTIVDGTGIVPTWSQRQVVSSAGGLAVFTPPYSYNGACSPLVTLTSSPNQTSSSSTFIFGNGEAIPGQNGSRLVRSDGRLYPLGQKIGQGFVNGGTTATVVAAPGAGLSIMLKAVQFAGEAAGVPGLDVTIGGNTVSLVVNATGGPISTSMVFESGLLCDPNTAVTVGASAATLANGTAVYDIVV